MSCLVLSGGDDCITSPAFMKGCVADDGVFVCLKGKGDCTGKLFVRAKIKGNTSPRADNALSA